MNITTNKLAGWLKLANSNNKLLKLVETATSTGLTDGGCGVYAHAIKQVLPAGRIVTVVKVKTNSVEHYGVKYKGYYLDGIGATSGEDMWTTVLEEAFNMRPAELRVLNAYKKSSDIVCSGVCMKWCAVETELAHRLRLIWRKFNG